MDTNNPTPNTPSENNNNRPRRDQSQRRDQAPRQPLDPRAFNPVTPKPAGARDNSGARDSSGPRSNGNDQGAKRQGTSNRDRDRRRRQGQMMPSHTDLLPSLDSMPVNKSLFNGFGGLQQTKAKSGAGSRDRADRGPANAVAPRETKLRVMPLGGLGEIGKNMTAVEYGDDIVILDMGFGFPDANQPGVDYIIPDVTYLEQNRHKIRGIIITHGHMDHIGAAGYMIPKFPVPIYGSRLSLAFVAKQIEEFRITTPQFIVLDPDKHERVQLGVFNIELVRVTHTIADSTAVVLRTPVGTIIDTGDWRPDPTPLDGVMMDLPRLAEIAEEGVLLLMSDSTSCDQAGHTVSERVVEPTIHDLFSRAENRIIVSSFSSSITRVQLMIDATAKSGRKLAHVGRSMLGKIELCVKLGYLKVPQGLLIKVQDAGNLPGNQVVILCTGSQGEENSALVRMSTGDHPHVKIKPGDSIILSSSVIPGNEVSVVRLLDNLMREGANVFARSTELLKGHGPLHVGGHAKHEDSGDLVRLIHPKFYMPIHGEFHHLVYNADSAVENGVPRENCFVMDNGDVLELTANTCVRGERIPAGMVMVDGSGIGDVEGVVLRDRLALGGEGVFMVVATVSRKTGRLVSSPDIVSRGFIYMKDNEELINKARVAVRQVFEHRNPNEPLDWAKLKLKLRDEIGDLLYGYTKRTPMVLPVINEV